jgi:hypothetical protein
VQNKPDSKRINGAALEMIMRDVLDGMFDFTRPTCCGSGTGKMEIIAVEKAVNGNGSDPRQAGIVIPFPLKTSGK